MSVFLYLAIVALVSAVEMYLLYKYQKNLDRLDILMLVIYALLTPVGLVACIVFLFLNLEQIGVLDSVSVWLHERVVEEKR